MADPALPRQVAEVATVATVNAARRTPTHRAGRRGGPHMGGNDDAVAVERDPVDGKPGREQGMQCIGQGNRCSEGDFDPLRTYSSRETNSQTVTAQTMWSMAL